MPLLLTFPTGSVKEYWEKTKIPLRFTPFQSNGRETACQCRPQRRLRSPRARLDRPRPVGMPRSPPIQRRSQSRTTRERQSTETPGRRRARRPGTTGEAAAAAGARRGRRRKPRCRRGAGWRADSPGARRGGATRTVGGGRPVRRRRPVAGGARGGWKRGPEGDDRLQRAERS